ncbi:MAG TPA: hypothetical protein VHE14_09100 [Solirubrobacteraceae bacterium]|nr:hypothetical protein [Solirubrobacteraceae bacterium]
MPPLDELGREFGTDLPPSIAGLDAAHRDTLARALRAAREHQAVALETAIDSGLGFVPRLLRGVVRKVLFG